MPRPRLGARLYLDPKRQEWIIRDGAIFKRTGCAKHETDKAEAALVRHIRITHPERTIYFITCLADNFPIKIGQAIDLNNRLMNLSSSMPYQPVLLAAFAGKPEDEGKLHKKFSHLRLRGEWFKRDPELLEYIEALKKKFEVIAEPKTPDFAAWRALALSGN